MLDIGLDFLKHIRDFSASVLLCWFAMALEPCSVTDPAWMAAQAGSRAHVFPSHSCQTVHSHQYQGRNETDKRDFSKGRVPLPLHHLTRGGKKGLFSNVFFNSSAPIPGNSNVHHREKQRSSWGLRRAGQVRESSSQRQRLLPGTGLCLPFKSLVLDNLLLGHGWPLLLQCCQALWTPSDPWCRSLRTACNHAPDFHKSPQLYEIRGLLITEIKTFSTYLLIQQPLLWSQVPVLVYIKFQEIWIQPSISSVVLTAFSSPCCLQRMMEWREKWDTVFVFERLKFYLKIYSLTLC